MTPTTDLLALLSAVIADPASDNPRLVYADACDDAGDVARGEFIRVQCELARREEAAEHVWGSERCCSQCKAIHDLRRWERELLRVTHDNRANWQKWAGPLTAHPWICDTLNHEKTPGDLRFRFCRGFVAELQGSAVALLGRPCPGCIEPGELDDGDSRCRLCSGTGRTEGIARRVMRTWEACGRCDGGGRVNSDKPFRYTEPCPHCTAGLTPRPVPPGCQPVTRVVLTTWPDEREPMSLVGTDWEQGGDNHREFTLTILRREFGPHVEWVLPPTPPAP